MIKAKQKSTKVLNIQCGFFALLNRIENLFSVQYEQICGAQQKQFEVLQIDSKVELSRSCTMKQHILPGGLPCDKF